jgi:hypothetical protein
VAAAGRPGEGREGRTIANSPDQAESRFRPRARRERRTARPPRVRMRVRKPCVFLRFRVFGWYVRFTGPPRRWVARGRSRDPRGRRNAPVYRRPAARVQRERRRSQPAGTCGPPLVGLRGRCYVSAPRGAAAGRRELPW